MPRVFHFSGLILLYFANIREVETILKEGMAVKKEGILAVYITTETILL